MSSQSTPRSPKTPLNNSTRSNIDGFDCALLDSDAKFCESREPLSGSISSTNGLMALEKMCAVAISSGSLL